MEILSLLIDFYCRYTVKNCNSKKEFCMRLAVIISLITTLLCAHCFGSSEPDFNWVTFYKALPEAQPDADAQKDDDSSSWDSSSSGSSDDAHTSSSEVKDRVDFQNLVGDIKLLDRVTERLTENKYSANAVGKLAKSRDQNLQGVVRRKINAIIAASTSLLDLKKAAEAAAKDPDYEKKIEAVDAGVDAEHIISEEQFLAVKKVIVKAYAKLKTDAARDDFLTNYHDTDGNSLSLDQREQVRLSILSPEAFAAVKDSIVEQYVISPAMVKPQVLERDVDGKVLTAEQKESIMHVVGSLSEEKLEEFVVQSFSRKSDTIVDEDGVTRLLRNWGMQSRIIDMSQFASQVQAKVQQNRAERVRYKQVLQEAVHRFASTIFSRVSQAGLQRFLQEQGYAEFSAEMFEQLLQEVNTQAFEKSEELRRAEKEKQDEQARRRSASPYMLSEEFEAIKATIVEIYRAVLGYAGLEACVLHGKKDGKPLSEEQRKLILAEVDRAGVAEQSVKLEDEWSSYGDLSYLKEKSKEYITALKTWNNFNLTLLRRRFVLHRSSVSFSDVQDYANMLGVKEYVAKKKSNDLSNSDFVRLKDAIFHVYKEYKTNPLKLRTQLIAIVGVKQLAKDQIRQLDAMMGADSIDLDKFKRRAAQFKKAEVPEWQDKIRAEMSRLGATQQQIEDVLGKTDSHTHAEVPPASGTTKGDDGGHAPFGISVTNKLIDLNQTLRLVATAA